MTSAARDLMESGTPGPWTKRTAWSVADALHHEDARKIVLSVNALPLVDALCEALDNYATAIEADRADAWRLVCLAHLALEAALRGEG